jgi:hypothetical protein
MIILYHPDVYGTVSIMLLLSQKVYDYVTGNLLALGLTWMTE